MDYIEFYGDIKISKKDAKEVAMLINSLNLTKIRKGLKKLDELFGHKTPTTIEIKDVNMKSLCEIGCVIVTNINSNIIINPRTVKEEFRTVARLRDELPEKFTHMAAVIFHEYAHIEQFRRKKFKEGTDVKILEEDADDFTRKFLNFI